MLRVVIDVTLCLVLQEDLDQGEDLALEGDWTAGVEGQEVLNEVVVVKRVWHLGNSDDADLQEVEQHHVMQTPGSLQLSLYHLPPSDQQVLPLLFSTLQPVHYNLQVPLPQDLIAPSSLQDAVQLGEQLRQVRAGHDHPWESLDHLEEQLLQLLPEEGVVE